MAPVDPRDEARDAAGRVYRRRRDDSARGGDAGMFVGLPIWARIVGLVGIPGTIALFAVWVGAQSIPKLQTEMSLLREALQAQNVLSLTIANKADEHTRLLQKICSAQFSKEDEKQRCFDR